MNKHISSKLKDGRVDPVSLERESYELLRNMMVVLNRYYNTPSEEKFLADSSKKLLGLLDKIVQVGSTTTMYQVFLHAFTLFANNGFTFSNTSIEAASMDLFYRFVFLETEASLAAWKIQIYKDYTNKSLIHCLLDVRVLDANQARCKIKHMDIAIRLMTSEKERFRLDEIEFENLSRLTQGALDCYKQWFDVDAYLDYFYTVLTVDEVFEASYILALLEHKGEEKARDYISSVRTNVTTLVRTAMSLDENVAVRRAQLETIESLFTKNPLHQTYKLLSLFVEADVFATFSDKLVKIAKKKSSYNYFEIQIIIDKEQAFELLRKGNIFEFNRHLGSYLPEKEEEILFINQEKLTDLLSDMKTMNKKYEQLLQSFEVLAKLKNGKYFIFSIVRGAWNKSDQEMGIDVYQSLMQYLRLLNL